MPRRYSDDLNDPVGRIDESSDAYKIVKNEDSDDDDTLERGDDDPLSLEELDGWMNQINKNNKEDLSELKPKATIGETNDACADSQQAEAEYLKKELAELQGEGSPFGKTVEDTVEVDGEIDEDEDELNIDFIAHF